MKDQLLRRLISPFPPDSIFRKIGKRLCRGLTARQNFYDGVIYFDAIGQSWALKGTPYETVDTQLKDELLALSKGCRHYLDIGCNIGQITLSILLRNLNISAVCVDPNARVLKLLKKSLRANSMEHRATIKQAVVGNEKGFVCFDSGALSEMGHVSQNGTRVECLCLSDLINEYSSQKCLVKIDVEGFETILLKKLDQFRNLKNVSLAIELHAFGYNQGDPEECVKLLMESGATLRHLSGLPVSSIDPTQITQIVASWGV